MFLNSSVRERDMVDGASYTLFVGEKRNEPNDLGWLSGTRATLRNTGTVINATPAEGPAASGVQMILPPPPPLPEGTLEDSDSNGRDDASEQPDVETEPGAASDRESTTVDTAGAATDEDASTDAGDEDNTTDLDDEPTPSSNEDATLRTPEQMAAARAIQALLKNPLYVGGFGSPHSGGAYFVFGDGSVQFLSDSMDHRAFEQAGNRADGKLPLPGMQVVH